MTISPTAPAKVSELKGARCTLKPMLIDHVTPAYVDWLNDPEINRYLESRFAAQTMESVRAFVAAQAEDHSVHLFGIWVPAEHGDDDRHVGNIKLGPIHPYHKTADMGFLIGERSYWGQGIASEAIELIVKFGFALGVRKITAGAYENNLGSAKALLKAGFVEEGFRSSQVVFGDTRVGISLFGITCS